MPVSEKEHFDALRAADQRAVELLATANAARINNGFLFAMFLVSILSLAVAVAAIIWKH